MVKLPAIGALKPKLTSRNSLCRAMAAQVRRCFCVV